MGTTFFSKRLSAYISKVGRRYFKFLLLMLWREGLIFQDFHAAAVFHPGNISKIFYLSSGLR